MQDAVGGPKAVHHVTITDRWGNPHEYTIYPHPPREGMVVVDFLLGLGITPLLEAMLSVEATQTAGGDVKVDTESLQATLSKIDRAAIAADVRRALTAAGGLAKVAPMLLARTSRDGARLSDPGAFDVAFAQNYGEARKAIMEVVSFNGFMEALFG